ncbi:acylphosphatase [Myxococcota bacterium]|nr:acylphosphatase [Myxococcota bacterium]
MREARASVHVLASGIVQGVGYRAFTERAARELGVTGWVRNLHDGRVEVLAEAERPALEALLERLGRGPRSAEVSGLAVRWIEATGAAAFTVRRDADEPERFG